MYHRTTRVQSRPYAVSGLKKSVLWILFTNFIMVFRLGTRPWWSGLKWFQNRRCVSTTERHVIYKHKMSYRPRLLCCWNGILWQFQKHSDHACSRNSHLETLSDPVTFPQFNSTEYYEVSIQIKTAFCCNYLGLVSSNEMHSLWFLEYKPMGKQ